MKFLEVGLDNCEICILSVCMHSWKLGTNYD